MKRCTRCKKEKEAADFSPWRQSKDGLACWCKRCNADAMLARYHSYAPGTRPPKKRKPETLRAQRARYYKRHRPETRANQNGRNHGISGEEYVRLRARPCAICGIYKESPKRGSGMHIDHDHATGRIRGTLCDRCNRGLGMFDDRVELLRAAADYVAGFTESGG